MRNLLIVIFIIYLIIAISGGICALLLKDYFIFLAMLCGNCFPIALFLAFLPQKK